MLPRALMCVLLAVLCCGCAAMDVVSGPGVMRSVRFERPSFFKHPLKREGLILRTEAPDHFGSSILIAKAKTPPPKPKPPLEIIGDGLKAAAAASKSFWMAAAAGAFAGTV